MEHFRKHLSYSYERDVKYVIQDMSIDFDNVTESYDLPGIEYLNQLNSKFHDLYRLYDLTPLQFEDFQINLTHLMRVFPGFLELFNHHNMYFAAYYDYLSQTTLNDREGSSFLGEYGIFGNNYNHNLLNILLFKDHRSAEVICLISLKPSDVQFYEVYHDQVPTFNLHNPNGYAITFSDGWGLNFIHGTYFNKHQFDKFVKSKVSADKINRMDYMSRHPRIIHALRKLYSYRTPKLFEFWNWFHPDDEEWPEDATEEDARLAIEREKNETHEQRTARFEEELEY
ncbi:MAG: hypothetical protein GPJ54_16190 [Candidatus Heimdallarchaeota archaeon]|nr:hypothetical protein [Candidatus Heimdallarchaeota archaeon]